MLIHVIQSSIRGDCVLYEGLCLDCGISPFGMKIEKMNAKPVVDEMLNLMHEVI